MQTSFIHQSLPYRLLFLISSLIFVLMTSTSSYAIVNTESLRPESHSGWKGNIGLKGEGSRGNTDKSIYSAEIGLGYFEERETFGVASYSYGESRGVKDAHNSFFHLRHNEKIRSLLKWEAFYQWQSDEFKRLEQRQLLGTGLRWGIYDKNPLSIWTGLGAFLYEERISEFNGIPSYSESSGRGNLYLVVKWNTLESAKVLSTIYYQPRLSDGKDYQVLWDLGVFAPITIWAELSMEYSVAYDSRPPQAVRSTDQRYVAGVNIKF